MALHLHSITNDDAGMPQKQRLRLESADRKDPSLGPTNRRRRDVQVLPPLGVRPDRPDVLQVSSPKCLKVRRAVRTTLIEHLRWPRQGPHLGQIQGRIGGAGADGEVAPIPGRCRNLGDPRI
jgi:hypothetical protein